jgi:thiamine biosynthesis lipoprotein ApbE
VPPATASTTPERRFAALAHALRREVFGLVGLPLLALAALPGCAPQVAESVVIERELGVMGTHLALSIGAPTRAQALAASEAAVRAVEAAEARLSNWRADSELALLVDASAPSGSGLAASPQLAADLAALAPCAARVAGAFDPTVASPGRGPHGAIDSGGFGKGRALDLALAAARAHGATTVELDLGGQTARLVDGAASDTPSDVQLADPRDRNRAVVAVEHAFASVATSCQSERAGHVVDPATGAAAPFDGALTVFANDALLADVLSTGLFVLGRERALELAELHGDFDVLVLEPTDSGLRVHTSAGLVGRVRALAADVSIAPAAAVVDRDEHQQHAAPIAGALR